MAFAMFGFGEKHLLAYAILAGAGLACSATSQDLGNSDRSSNGGASTEPPPVSAVDVNPVPPEDTAQTNTEPIDGERAAFVAGVPFHRVSVTLGNVWGLWGSGAADVWAVGDANGIAHYDGTQWSFFRKPDTSRSADTYALNAVSGTGPTSAWAVGGVHAGIAQVFRWTGSDWVKPAAHPREISYVLYGVWAADDEDVWIAGKKTDGEKWWGYAAHLHDGVWQDFPGGVGSYLSVWGSDATHVWIGGKDKILAYDGTTLTPVATGLSSEINAITGTSANDVWAFGTSGFARHWDGATWTTTPVGAPILFAGAFARAPNDVFAVGQLPGIGSVVAHWDGTRWTRGSTNDGAGLTAVWGGPNDIWAMGLGVVYHGK